MKLSCAEFEILLCDAADGQLWGEAEAAFEGHRKECAGCREYAADILGAVEFMSRAAVVEPPKELITKILFDLPVGQTAAGRAKTGLVGVLGRWFGPVLAPRMAMGMAMTVLSLSMLAQVFKMPVRQLKPSDLDPVKIWVSVDDQAHRAWNRAVKYYDNIRLVFEIQSRLQEWTEQEELDRQQKARNGAEKIFVPTDDRKPLK